LNLQLRQRIIYLYTEESKMVKIVNNYLYFGNESIAGSALLITEDDEVLFDLPEMFEHYYVASLYRTRDGVKGRASSALKELCNWADTNEKNLVLCPVASGDLTQRELVSWYNRNGFKWAACGYMVRFFS
jgi:hypothetical protein